MDGSDNLGKPHPSGTSSPDMSRILRKDKQEKQKLLEKYDKYTEKHIKPFYDFLYKYAYIFDTFSSISKPLRSLLDKMLEESEIAQENLKNSLLDTDTTIFPG